MWKSPRLAAPLLASLLAAGLASCNQLGIEQPAPSQPPQTAAPAPPKTIPLSNADVAPPRISGLVQPSNPESAARPRIVLGNNPSVPVLAKSSGGLGTEGDISLNYVDTDIREIARIILGNLLKVNYTIDPAVKGTVTVQTPTPVNRDALIPLLESVLAENGAALSERDGIYMILPAAKAANEGLAPSEAGMGASTEVVPLRYATAKDLAKVLQPYIGEGARMIPASAGNALLVTGSTSARANIIALIRTFDVDYLAGQSYAIFPVKSDDPAKVATEIQHFADASMEGGAEGAMQVIPIDRVNAVLVIARQPIYLERISRFLARVDEVGERTARQLHVYYVQNGIAADLAALLQKAFAPRGVPASEAQPSPLAPGTSPTSISSSASSAGAQASGGQPATSAPSGLGQSGLGQPGQGQLGASSVQLGGGAAATTGAPPSSYSSTAEPATPSESESGSEAPQNGIRIIPDKKNNALLIYATPDEYGLIEATLSKIDVLPLQVLVDATIAEVTLNDQLQYGTQWFFKKSKFSGVFSDLNSGAVSPTFPGFNFIASASGVNVALDALEQVTTVKVISAPELVVLDNEKARLQVGNLVPIITQSAVSVLTSGAPIVNSVEYRETGVILEVAPRVNSGGLVTLDITQEVSNVLNTTTSTIDSPTISQRKIKTRVVVHDGETIGLGGLITDQTNIGNSGLPWLSLVPVVGALFGVRSNTAARTELLVLLTPHVIHDQRDVRGLTDELKQRLGRLSARPVYHDPVEPPGPLRSLE